MHVYVPASKLVPAFKNHDTVKHIGHWDAATSAYLAVLPQTGNGHAPNHLRGTQAITQHRFFTRAITIRAPEQ